MPSWLIVILVCAVLFFLAVFLQAKSTNKLVEQGRIIRRERNFMEQAEIFTLKSVSTDQIVAGLKDVNAKTKVGVNGNMEQGYTFDGGSYSRWRARLRCTEKNESQSIFRFVFTEWETHNDRPKDDTSMNILLTAVEKMFLQLDPQTQVRTEPVEIQSKRK